MYISQKSTYKIIIKDNHNKIQSIASMELEIYINTTYINKKGYNNN